MPTPALFPIDWHQFDHIVLDFGGVLYEIDHNRTAKAFAELGLPNFEQEFRHSQQSDLFNAIETGGIDENDFLNSLRDRCDKGTTNEDVLEAWNALLIGLRPEAMPWLKTLNHQFDVILFSNTNALHAAHFEQQILNSKQQKFPESFRQMVYSHRLGHRKPQVSAFEEVATQFDLNPAKTLLIDDTRANVAGAINAGWSAVYFDLEAHSIGQFLRGIGYEDFLND
ncbi:HAD-IA family hydrolase [Flavobacteriales bacterium]|nr:HAD-IA family hydrolase [Flavobacteriales bacterium]